MIKIIFLCEGNICRSPSAEFMLKAKLKEMNIDSLFDVTSRATVFETAGSKMSSHSIAELKKHNIPYTEHIAKPINKSEYENADYVIIMEFANLILLKRLIFIKDKSKIHRLLDYTDKPGDIADPYYTNKFDVAYNDIERGIEGFSKHLFNTHCKTEEV